MRHKKCCIGGGCGTVGRAVASNTRGPRFESSHWQTLYIEHVSTVNCIEKTKIKKKRSRMAHLFKKMLNFDCLTNFRSSGGQSDASEGKNDSDTSERRKKRSSSSTSTSSSSTSHRHHRHRHDHKSRGSRESDTDNDADQGPKL